MASIDSISMQTLTWGTEDGRAIEVGDPPGDPPGFDSDVGGSVVRCVVPSAAFDAPAEFLPTRLLLLPKRPEGDDDARGSPGDPRLRGTKRRTIFQSLCMGSARSTARMGSTYACTCMARGRGRDDATSPGIRTNPGIPLWVSGRNRCEILRNAFRLLSSRCASLPPLGIYISSDAATATCTRVGRKPRSRIGAPTNVPTCRSPRSVDPPRTHSSSPRDVTPLRT